MVHFSGAITWKPLQNVSRKGLMMREFCTRVLFLYNFTSKKRTGSQCDLISKARSDSGDEEP